MAPDDSGGSEGSIGSETEAAESSGASTGTDTGTETGEAQACGDGMVEGEEACDDGNSVDGDGCNADCRPSGELRWTYSEAAIGRIAGTAVDPRGNVLAVGIAGYFLRPDPTLGAIRGFAPDGTVTIDFDDTPRGEAALTELVTDGNGAFLAFGYVSGERAWLRRMSADRADDTLYSQMTGFVDADASDAGIAVASTSAIGLLDVDGTLLWTLEVGFVDDVSLDGAGNVLAFRRPTATGSERRVTRYAPDGSFIGESMPFSDLSDAALARIDGLGVAVAGSGPFGALMLLDDELSLVWEVTMPNADWTAVADAGEGDLIAAGRTGVEFPAQPWIARYDAQGSARWTTAIPVDPPADEVRLYSVSIGADGTIATGGQWFDTDFDGHGFVAALSP